MTKRYINANELLQDTFLLAEKIRLSGFEPDLIIGIWRGGAPLGIAVQEWFAYHGLAADHTPIKTSSYTGIDQQNKEVKVYSLDYILENTTPESKVLFVDDVFDTGKTMLAILESLKAQAGDSTPKGIRIASPWYKPSRNVTSIVPDYYLYETDQWLVFPHELNGLTKEELLKGKPELADALNKL